jgi:hypothetical protein
MAEITYTYLDHNTAPYATKWILWRVQQGDQGLEGKHMAYKVVSRPGTSLTVQHEAYKYSSTNERAANRAV